MEFVLCLKDFTNIFYRLNDLKKKSQNNKGGLGLINLWHLLGYITFSVYVFPFISFSGFTFKLEKIQYKAVHAIFFIR